MKMYAVIHAVCGLFEGYSDTTCEFFPDKEAAQKHIDQCLEAYRKDEMCVNIDHDDHMPASTFVTMTNDPDDYNACVPEDMEHDDWVAENGDDCSVEVFRIVEIDAWRYNTKDSTESVWLTWDQLDTCVAWDYNPLCMSLVTRVSSDVHDSTNGDMAMCYALTQLNEFIHSVYRANHAFIDVDDYVMHAFRIPKKLNTND